MFFQKFVYTTHAEDKLKEPESKKFGINKNLLEKTILNPISTEIVGNQNRVTGNLDREHSLIVVYRKESDKITLVITFFPAKKDRYEVKVLR